MKEIFKSWMDVEIITEKCPITVPTVHTYKYYSNYGAQIKEKLYRVIYLVHVCLLFTLAYILNLICDSRRSKIYYYYQDG